MKDTDIFSDWESRGILEKKTESWELSREALLRVDSLLHQFFFLSIRMPNMFEASKLIFLHGRSKDNLPGLLHPLSMMRRAHGLPSLDFKEIESQELPEPYKQLLAHEGDMTSRLENAYRSSIR